MLRLWDVTTGRLEGPPIQAHTGRIRGLAFSPVDQILASAGEDGVIRFWDPVARRPIDPPIVLNHDIRTIAFSSDGQMLAVAVEQDSKIELWNVKDRSQSSPLGGHESWISAMALDPEGQAIASASAEGVILLRDGEKKLVLNHGSQVWSLAFSPDGTKLASGGADRMVRLWDVATGRALGGPLVGHKDMILALAFSLDGKTLATAGGDKTILIWDLSRSASSGGPHLLENLSGHTRSIRSLAFTAGGELVSGGDDESAMQWTLDPRSSLTGRLVEQAEVQTVAVSPSGLVASGDKRGWILLSDLAGGLPTPLPLKARGEIFALSFGRHGEVLAAGGRDGFIRLWDVAQRTPSELAIPRADEAGGTAVMIGSLSFSPDGGRLAAGYGDGHVVLWDLATRHPLIGKGHSGQQVNGIAFSQDGRSLASAGNDFAIAIWDPATLELLSTIPAHENIVSSVAFQPGGRLLVSCSTDTSIKLWDRDHGFSRLGTFTGPGLMSAAAFSPDGKTLAASSLEGDLLLWDVGSRRLLASGLRGSDGTTSLAFSPGGDEIFLGDNEGVFRWTVGYKSLRTHACEIANRNLPRAEWRKYGALAELGKKICPELSK
jgi:WD40 repeat protein